MDRHFKNGQLIGALPRPVDEEDPTGCLDEQPSKHDIWALRPGLFFQAMTHPENERAVRARAGLLNILSVNMVLLVAISLQQQEADITPWRDIKPVLTIVASAVLADFALASALGLCASPSGIMGTLISYHLLRQQPIWVPARPKRFAWALGVCMVSCCLAINQLVGDYRIRKRVVLFLASTCMLLTFLEAALGLCVGCKMFGLYFAWKDLSGVNEATAPTKSAVSEQATSGKC